jgi:enamine deaminase RidA (YjgF/YER057c/UK114 family)
MSALAPTLQAFFTERLIAAHGEFFAEIRPLATMVGVAALIDPRMLVEIEAVAFLG